ncbi:MAG: tetratricopeptide repeat protein [Candidatus Rokubacteria bacterium]|nr:tetratricopeptide repeat protein [Candidatus Rokubacteria bacterium]
MTLSAIAAIVLIALLALALILWPLLRRGPTPSGFFADPPDRSDELNEEKTALYRALKELEFDYQAGHLSEDDYAALRSRYESRAAQILKELDALEAARPKAERRPPKREATAAAASARQPRQWIRSPVTLIVGAGALVVFGLTLGLGVARYTEPDRTTVPPGGRLPVPMDMPERPATAATDPSRPIPPEVFRGMLQAAHQSLDTGRYQEAIAAYQAVLKRDPKNVEAITHLGVILSIAGHDDNALEAFDKAIAIDPGYAHAWWDKARVLYEVKQDNAGAIQAWEKFVALVPDGEDRDRALRQIQEAKGRLLKSKK